MSRRPDIHPGPRVRWVPLEKKATSSDAEDAIFLASAYNLIPDDWQSSVLYSWLGRKADGKWCHGRCGIAVPRQNGKNGIIEVRELFGMVALGEAFLHAAHEVKTTRKAFKRLKYFFGEKADDPAARFPDLNALVAEVRNTNGQEAIFLKDVYDADGLFVRKGGSIEFVARSSGSGRGYTVDVLVLDEAQHLDEDELEAIRSAISSAPLGNPQIIYAGTPPNLDEGVLGLVWRRIRSGAGSSQTLTWTEYGVPDGPMPDLDDIELLFEVNPALELRHGNGAYGLTFDVVRGEKEDLSPEGYARERYGWWGNPETVRRGVIDMERWRELTAQDVPPPTKALIVVDVEPDLDHTTIGLAAAGPAGRTLVLVDCMEGTADAARQVQLLTQELDEAIEVALTPSAGATLSAKLTKRNVEHVVLTQADVGRGCMGFQEMVRTSKVVHVNQKEFNDAVRGAITRFVGDLQHWDRRDRDHPIPLGPLVAGGTAAHRWALATAQPETPSPPAQRARPRTKAHAMDRVGF